MLIIGGRQESVYERSQQNIFFACYLVGVGSEKNFRLYRHSSPDRQLKVVREINWKQHRHRLIKLAFI